MKLPQMKVVKFWLRGRVTTLLADVGLGTSLLVGELKFSAVNFARVRFQRAALCESLVALITPIRTHSYIQKYT